ncbi:MAG TPA: hypothetical protein VGE88_16905 [Lysobacter sp.]
MKAGILYGSARHRHRTGITQPDMAPDGGMFTSVRVAWRPS